MIDFLIEVNDGELSEFNLRKGQFHLINGEDAKKLLAKITHYKVKILPGGSSANTLYGIAMLGGNVAFCGKIGRDNYGDVFQEKMCNSGVEPKLTRSEKATGYTITFITPDSERTFAVYLGAALHLKEADIFFEDLRCSRILHIEGYQLEDKQLRQTSLHAMRFAKNHSIKISIDLGDPGIIDRNKADIKKIIEEYADIVFANEDEAKALVGLKPLGALNEIAKLTEVAIVKVGKSGSYIKQDSIIYKIPGYKADAVDTTGAGDMFAAGVLYGICCHYDLKICGHIGSYFAAKIVERIGARLEHIDREEIKELIKMVS